MPPTLTPQQFAQMGGTPTPSQQPSVLTPAQFQQMGGKPTVQTTQAQPSTFGHPLDALSNQYNNSISTAKEGVTSGSATMQKGGVGNVSKGTAQAGLGAAAAGVGAVFAPFAASADAIIPQGNSELGKFASDTAKGAVVGAELGSVIPGAGTLAGGGLGALFGAGMHVVNAVKDAIFAHTNISEPDKAMVNNALNVGLAVIGEKVGESKTGSKGLNTDISDISAQSVKENLPKLPPTTPPETQAPEFTPEELSTHLQGVAEDWAKPTTDPASQYANARTVLAKDPQIPTNLAKEGINPFTHIDDNGKFDTKSTAESIREDNGKLAEDNLRPALAEADNSTPPLAVSELSPSPDTTYGITAGMAEKVKAAIDQEQAALQRKYPNGMSLIDQLNEKINYAKQGGYAQFKPESENIKAIANRSISNSFDSNISTHVPADLDYDAFQTHLASRYKMADYLDALNGKKVPVSAKLNMIRMGSKFLGAAAMRHLVPGMGDLITSFAGYQSGKMLESYIEKLTNPMRDQFLQRMQQSNPEAVQGLQKYMSDAEVQRANTPRLPAGSALGTDKNPIITPAPKTPTSYEPQAQKINNESLKPTPPQNLLPSGRPKSIILGGVTKDGYLVDNSGNKVAKPSEIQIKEATKYGWSQNPKTGRFQRAYTSG